MTPDDYLSAARCPDSIKPQSFGLWSIARVNVPSLLCPTFTALYQHTEGTIHHKHGEVVMEDSIYELRQHLPIWLKARGRVLVTGLGLGCVVRGLIANPCVERIDVIEIDRGIIRVIGPEFAGSDRVNVIEGDALTHPIGQRDRWDFAWHDIVSTGEDLQLLHADLIRRFMPAVAGPQGAWKLPRFVARLAPQVAGLR